MANQFSQPLQGDDLIALPGMRFKSMCEEVLSLPLVVDPAYAVKDGSPIYLTNDKKGCTTTQNVAAGFVGAVVLNQVGKNQVGKAGKDDGYVKGDVVPVMVKGKLYVPVKSAVKDITTAVGADEQGNFDPSGTALNGVRYHQPSVGSKNLTVLELLGVSL